MSIVLFDSCDISRSILCFELFLESLKLLLISVNYEEESQEEENRKHHRDRYILCKEQSFNAFGLFLSLWDIWNKGNVYLCFQHGEETGKGADECVRYLKDHGGVDAVFAAHMLSILPSGMIVLQPGVVATGGIIFRSEIEGTSGHGGRPDLAISAADIMCDIYQHLVNIPSNRHEAAKTCVISPCVLNSGSRFNVIPDSAVIEGTIRFLGEDDGEILMEKVRRTSEAIASMHGGRAEVIYDEVSRYPVINDADMSAVGRKAAERLGFSLFDTEPTSASDNFAEFLHEYPGYYCFVGSKSDREGTSGVHHAPDFDLDESVLHMVPELFFETTLSLMN